MIAIELRPADRAPLEAAAQLIIRETGTSPSVEDLAHYVLSTANPDDIADMLCRALGLPLGLFESSGDVESSPEHARQP